MLDFLHYFVYHAYIFLDQFCPVFWSKHSEHVLSEFFGYFIRF